MIVFTAGSLKVKKSAISLFDRHQILSANGRNQNIVTYIYSDEIKTGVPSPRVMI